MPIEFILRSKGYSEATKVGNTIYGSGQVAVDQEGNVVGKGDAGNSRRRNKYGLE